MNCGYTAAVLDETLRDIFIVGLRNANIQKELLKARYVVIQASL